MNIEDIKVGETYNVRVKVIGKYGKCIDAIYADADDAIVGLHIPERRVGVLRPISPENGIKNTETAPKYDPCRRFRKGDRVSPCAWQDRVPTARMGACCIIPKPGIYEVLTDELHEMVSLRYGEDTIKMHICFLELVTPVEELGPYSVVGDKWYWHVLKEQNGGKITVCKFSKDFHPNAKAAAETERDRLNAEWRKEHGND